jgi:hypothetical protein
MCSRLALAAFVFTLAACASSGNDFSTVHPPTADATTSTSFASAPFYVDFRTGPVIGIVGIPGEVGQEDYFANLPSSATFHRNLTAEQYERLTG